jgi:hypothetical protein
MKILLQAIIGIAVVFGPATLIWILQDENPKQHCKNVTYPLKIDVRSCEK